VIKWAPLPFSGFRPLTNGETSVLCKYTFSKPLTGSDGSAVCCWSQRWEWWLQSQAIGIKATAELNSGAWTAAEAKKPQNVNIKRQPGKLRCRVSNIRRHTELPRAVSVITQLQRTSFVSQKSLALSAGSQLRPHTGLTRCRWKTLSSKKQYGISSLVTAQHGDDRKIWVSNGDCQAEGERTNSFQPALTSLDLWAYTNIEVLLFCQQIPLLQTVLWRAL